MNRIDKKTDQTEADWREEFRHAVLVDAGIFVISVLGLMLMVISFIKVSIDTFPNNLDVLEMYVRAICTQWEAAGSIIICLGCSAIGWRRILKGKDARSIWRKRRRTKQGT